MTALDVISLADAKDSLVVDYPDKDKEIIRHINTAISLVEQYTCYRLFERPISYVLKGKMEVYEFPLDIDAKYIYRTNALSVVLNGNETVNGTVGYSDVSQIPSPLIDACYKIIQYLFENKDIYSANLPIDVQVMINQYRRSATI